MFAGAAREAVFSNPDVVRRANTEFVPVALKAGLVNNPPDGPEGLLYRELARSMPAPQGIGVANPAGKVLAWALMFEDDKNVLAFLDHTRDRFQKYPDAKGPVPAERYTRFPSEKREDVRDTRAELTIPDGHKPGTDCPATPAPVKGTLDVRLYGRALGKDGNPLADTARQENYAEDRFSIDPACQAALAKALAAAGDKPFPLPDTLTQNLMGHAYLGMLDVNPVAFGGEVKTADLRGRKARADADGTAWVRVAGRTDVSGEGRPTKQKGDGRQWEHDITLTWSGLIAVKDDHVVQLLVTAEGTERLKWGNARFGGKDTPDVSRLPAGRPIDQTTAVRYGFVGTPVAGGRPATDPGPVPETAGARQQIVELVGGPALLFDVRARKELRLTDAQVKKIDKLLADLVERTGTLWDQIHQAEPEARGQRMDRHRHETRALVDGFARGLLEEDQLARLRQLVLWREGPLAIPGDPAVGAELKLTEKQRERMAEIAGGLQEQAGKLVRDAQRDGNAGGVREKLAELRKEAERKVEAELTADQRKRWRAMLGDPPAGDR